MSDAGPERATPDPNAERIRGTERGAREGDHETLSDAAGGPPPDPPAAVPFDETWRTLRRDLPPPPARLLEVGAGKGALARRMQDAGYDVTALDIDPAVVAIASTRGVRAVAGDIRDHVDAPFDVVLFTRSLHHIHPLGAALDRAHALLRGEGHLIVDDFRYERVDAITATWLADREAELGARGLLTEQDHWRRPGVDPLAAWLDHHRIAHDVHPGDALEAAIVARFDRVVSQPSAYLYRYLCARLRDLAGAGDEARRLLREEQAAIAAGTLRAVGCRWCARRSA